LLWLAGVKAALSNFPFGMGPHFLKREYFEIVERLFVQYPKLVPLFGPHTSSPNDFHFLPVSLLAEFGLLGLAALILVAIWVFKLSSLKESWSAERGLMLLKAFYTVVLANPTSLILFALAFKPPAGECTSGLKTRLIKVPVFSVAALLPFLVLPVARSSFHYEAALLSQARGDSLTARSSLAKALELNPAFPQALLLMGQIQFFAGEQIEGKETLLKAIAAETSIDTLKQSAAIFYHFGQVPLSAQLNERILSVYPEHLATMARLAQAYVRLRRRREALELSRRIRETVPRVKNTRDPLFVETANQILITGGRQI
jgi:tetratricopeptide (TPR) repeat protein